jgi:MFS family permease
VLRFSNADVGLVSSGYLAGAVMGALFFGWLTDRLGRKRLFFITLVVYLLATAATALSWNIWSFALFRFLTGAGIGGEYTAINSLRSGRQPRSYCLIQPCWRRFGMALGLPTDEIEDTRAEKNPHAAA